MTQSLGRCYTLGKLSERLQRAPGQIEGVIERLGIQPLVTLNDLRYYGESAEAEIDTACRRADAERILGRPIPAEVAK